MEQWQEEKAALLATIRRHERHASALSKRFKLLQRTLAEQQRTLDRYQRALQKSDARAAKALMAEAESSPRSERVQQARSAASSSLLPSGPSSCNASRHHGIPRCDQRKAAEDKPRCASPLIQRPEASEAPPSPDLLAVTGASVAKDGNRGERAAFEAPGVVQVQQPSVNKDAAAPLKAHSSFVRDEARAEGDGAVSTGEKSPLGDAWVKRKAVLSSNTKPALVSAKPPASRSTPAKVATVDVSTVATSPVPATVVRRALKRPLPLQPIKRSAMAPTWAEEKRRMQQAKKAKSNRVAANPVPSPLQKTLICGKSSRQDGRQEGDFAYVEVVRNREERAALPAHDCAECRQYYEALGDLVSAEDVAAHKNRCSRHRARYEPYQTPDDFWRLSFPDSVGLAEPQTP